MADEEELYFANLDEFVNDEDKIVTYKWLSRTLSVPVNKAKQMLYAFVQKQKGMKSAPHLNITYVIGGRCSVEGDTVHRYVITHDKDLEETKKTFSPVTSLHIYSIQKCRLKDSNSLYTVDYEIQQQHNSEDNRWSHICCSSAKRLADDGVQRGTHKVVNIDEKCSTTKMVNGDCESSHACKGLSTVGAEQKAKVSSSKTKKGQKSALEMFAAKPPTSKTEKNNNKKAEPAREQKEDKSKAAQAKSDNNKAGTMKSFFGQNTAVKKVTEKPAVTTGKGKEADSTKKNETIPEKQNQTVQSNREKKRELSSEDEEEPLPAKFSKAVKSDSKESKAKGDKKKAQKQEKEKKIEPTKSNKAGKKKAVISEPDEEPEEKPKKRRKRMKELPKEDSSDDEKTVSNNAESVKKPSSDQGSSRSKSPMPQQQPPQTDKDTSRRRKRKRELKSKTFMNDEGYMVTEKVWESESTDASDDELQITNPPVNEKRPSPAKKAASKKTHADIKNKTAKQASLTSFFKKS